MRKLILLTALLTLSIGAWAQETQSVNYIDANYQQQTVTATVITNSASILDAGWYVVLGNDVQTNTLTCNGAVNLILADGAKLTAQGDNTSQTPGVQVSGEGNSLAIYGQAAQSGQLIATGGRYAAGIGGGYHSSGSNITINGGTVTANGEYLGAGIGGGNGGSGSNITINGGTVTATGGGCAAGIGGGNRGSGSNITINGGTVTASGGEYGAGIGGGYNASGSNIRIAFELTVYADNQNPPTTEIPHATDYDIAQYLNGRRYVIVKDVITGLKSDAIAAINAAISDTDNDNVKAIAANAETAINAATSIHEIDAIKTQALADIASAKAILGPLGTEQPGPAVKVTKGEKEVILYLPDKVEYIIRK